MNGVSSSSPESTCRAFDQCSSSLLRSLCHPPFSIFLECGSYRCGALFHTEGVQLLRYLVYRWSNSNHCLLNSHCGQGMWKVWFFPWLWRGPMSPTGWRKAEFRESSSVSCAGAACSMSLDCAHLSSSSDHSIHLYFLCKQGSLAGLRYQIWFSLLDVQAVGGVRTVSLLEKQLIDNTARQLSHHLS